MKKKYIGYSFCKKSNHKMQWKKNSSFIVLNILYSFSLWQTTNLSRKCVVAKKTLLERIARERKRAEISSG